MSDKYITYGKGCEIDPARYWPSSENAEMYLRVDSPKILRALQQREEMRLEALRIANERYDSIGSDWAEREILSEIIDILEGTDG